MSMVVLCPDDLVGQARAGAAPARADIAVHLQGCAACRTALAVVGAFEHEPAVLAGDDRLLARLVSRAGQEAERAGVVRAASGRRRVAIAAVLMALVAGSAAAAFWSARGGGRRPPPARAAITGAAPSPVVPPAAVPVTAPPLSPAAPVAPPPVVGQRPPLSPGALLRRAREARAGGERSHALALYQRLQRQYPASAEATIAHVSAGALLLEGGDGRAALAAFDRYLAAAPGGALREEAMSGRARAFAALGDGDGERGAWQRLIGAFPQSIHTAVARQRLRELGGGGVDR